MKRLITRSRSLVLVAVLAVVAAMCTVSTANAASSTSAAPREPAASSTKCNFVESLQTCESTDPTVSYTDNAYGKTSGCTFVFSIAWGDGGATTETVTDPTDGPHLLATHSYAGPGVYTITVTVQVTAGNCTGTNSVHTFTLTNAATPAAPSNLTATAVSPTSVRLTWTNNAANQSGVVISRNGVVSVDVQGATVSSYTWNGLSPGTKYWFYVASKIYGTPGDPTGSGNTQSAWVGPVYVTTDQQIPVKTLKVKSYSQNLVSNLNEYCGPTSVAMALDYYNKFSSSISNNPTKQIENVLTQTPGGSVNGTVASDLEAALASSKGEYSPATYSELPEPLNIYDLATAIEQGHPVIAFVNANYLSPARSYSGHWLVVTGFSVSAGVTNVLVNDPDQTREGLPGADQPIPLSTFETAASHYAGYTSVAGIIVTG